MKFKTLLAAAALMTFGMSAQATHIIDLSGVAVDGAGLNIFTQTNVPAGEVVDVSFDFTYEAGPGGGGSWGSEVVLELLHVPTGVFFQIGTQDEGCDAFGLTCAFDLMWDDAPGIFTASGSVMFNGAIADGSGDYQITIGDSFDDPGLDGVFLAGSNLTINQLPVVVAPVPVPGTLLLVGIGIAGLGLARRRTA